jgi:hypothetical protein
MPNWCDNSIKISHEDKARIDAIDAELSKVEPQLFNSINPRPADQEENWYDWNVNNWGTKWDASVIDFTREDDNTIIVTFDTAWSPPIKLYYWMIEEGFGVHGYYNEGGMGFAGIFDNGNDEYHEYDISDLESIEAMPEELIEYTNARLHHEDWKDNEEHSGSYEREEFFEEEETEQKLGN